MRKVFFSGTPDTPFFSELWSSQAYEAAERYNFEPLIPDFTREEADTARWIDFLSGAEAVITTWLSPCFGGGLLQNMPELRIIGHAAGSLSGYVTPELFRAGVKVTSANCDMAHAVAEWCLLGALAGRRNICAYSKFGTLGNLDFPHRSNCRSVRGATVGIWGYGAVASCLIEMLRPLLPGGIIVYSKHLSGAAAAGLGVEKCGFDELLKQSDIFFTLAGLNEETTGMLNREKLSLLKDGMTLVNGGRGQLMNEADFYAELALKRFNAVLDVYHTEPLPESDFLHTLDNVILTPHNAGYPSRHSYIGTVLAEFDRFFSGKALQNEIPEEKIQFMTDNKVNR